MSAQTTGTVAFANWQESAVGPSDASPKIAQAAVTNTFSGGIEAESTSCQFTLVYVTELTGVFNGMELVTGRLDGRKGTFAVEERGTFDEEGTIRCAMEVVPGSGTGELAGLRGTGEYINRRGEPTVTYTFDYELG